MEKTFSSSYLNNRNTSGQEKKPTLYALESKIGEGDYSADVVLIPQPFASLIVKGKQNHFVSPYPISGTKLVYTGEETSSWQKAIFKERKLNTAVAGYATWESLPQKAILGEVMIETCEMISEETTNSLRLGEKEKHFYTEGAWICHIKSALSINPIYCKFTNIVTSLIKDTNIHEFESVYKAIC